MFAFFTPGKKAYFEISDDHPPNTEPRTVTHARDHWWTFDFANAFVSPDVISRVELVTSPGLSPGTAHRAVGSGIKSHEKHPCMLRQ
jgi:hypothetical protein